MRSFAIALAISLVAGAAQAMPGGSKPDPPSSSNPPASSSSAQASGPRADAERTYALAYDEVAKGNKELAAGKTKNAQKKFKKALGYAESSTSYDANYFEAWNLVGYCARKLGDYDKAFTAYDKSLAIKPDYAPARQYLGEAHLEKGDLQKAQEQLSMLEKDGHSDEEASRLFAAIEAYKKAHPEAAAAPAQSAPAAATAPPDSTSGR